MQARDELVAHLRSLVASLSEKPTKRLTTLWAAASLDLTVIGLDKYAKAAAENLKSAEAARDEAQAQLKAAEEATKRRYEETIRHAKKTDATTFLITVGMLLLTGIIAYGTWIGANKKQATILTQAAPPIVNLPAAPTVNIYPQFEVIVEGKKVMVKPKEPPK